jgi:putative DNA methylase
MVEAYSAMAGQMPDKGFQVVMFTHQDVGVWADLAEILWGSGLQVTAGWCIATETESATRVGNYVQGTVLLVLRKRLGNETGFIARLQRPVENAVRAKLQTMRVLDHDEEPNFGDADYQLAAYAAALEVLTRIRSSIIGRSQATCCASGGRVRPRKSRVSCSGRFGLHPTSSYLRGWLGRSGMNSAPKTAFT